MNPDLQKYIDEARRLGKTSEIIKQELKSGGWTDADIAQAMGATPAPATPISSIPPMNASKVAIGTSSTKMIVSVIVAIFLLGGGAYLFLSRNSTPNSASMADTTTTQVQGNTQGNSNQTATTFPFHCSDLFTDADFQRIYNDNPADYDFKESSDTNNLDCDWSLKEDLLQKRAAQGKPVFNIGSFIINNDPNAFYTLKQHFSKDTDFKQINNLGSDAYSTPILNSVLSSSKKYVINGENLVNSLSIQVVKTVDSNLNKY